MMRKGQIGSGRGSTRACSPTRLVTAAGLAALSLLLGASSSAASVTLGQLAPGSPPPSTCGGATVDNLQPTVGAGASYVVPGTGTITSWSHNAAATAGQMLTMKVFRKVADPATYAVVGHEGPRAPAPAVLNGFPASIPVKPGDVLGLNTASPGGSACSFFAAGDSYLSRVGNMVDGESEAFGTPVADRGLNLAAIFVPSNAFTVRKPRRNLRRGTATLVVEVPNPGALTASGKGIKAASAGGAVISKKVAAGRAKLVIKAKGKQAKRLRKTGKVTLKPKISYTPNGGDRATRSTKLKLKKR
jgi:hypothetical protein